MARIAWLWAFFMHTRLDFQDIPAHPVKQGLQLTFHRHPATLPSALPPPTVLGALCSPNQGACAGQLLINSDQQPLQLPPPQPTAQSSFCPCAVDPLNSTSCWCHLDRRIPDHIPARQPRQPTPTGPASNAALASSITSTDEWAMRHIGGSQSQHCVAVDIPTTHKPAQIESCPFWPSGRSGRQRQARSHSRCTDRAFWC
jgi:hypothetical protein